MALKKRFRPRTAPPRTPQSPRGYQSRLPHPSWRLAPADAGGLATIATAQDFWSRLGL